MNENLSFTQELRKNGLIVAEKEEKEEENPIEQNNNNENSDETFDEKLIYVGKKPSMNYVMAINARMKEGLDEITIKARGNTISKAVDIAEIVINRYITDANDNQIKISTEEIVTENGNKKNISTIEILIKRD